MYTYPFTSDIFVLEKLQSYVDVIYFYGNVWEWIKKCNIINFYILCVFDTVGYVCYACVYVRVSECVP